MVEILDKIKGGFMKHRLTVKIEKRFKGQLSKRFNPRNAQKSDWVGEKEIDVECSLCREFRVEFACSKCPFAEFEEKINRGCLVWIERIMGKDWYNIFDMGDETISWNKANNKEAIELFKKLREKAKKYIIWVENTG